MTLPQNRSQWGHFAGALAAISGLIFVGGLGVIGYSWNWIRTASRTEAEIVSYRRMAGGEVAPTLHFKDQNGAELEVASSRFRSEPIGEVGEMVAILYQPETPENIRLDRFGEKWAIGVLMCALGAFYFCLCGWVSRRLGRKTIGANKSE